MKRFYLLFALFASVNGICGTFTKTADHCYDYTGDIESNDVFLLESLHKENPKDLTITINSLGGEYTAGLALGEYTHDNNIKIIVDTHASSAAGFWALGDNHYKYKIKDSYVLLHLPYLMSGETTDTPELWCKDGMEMYIFLTEIAGWKKNKTVFVIDEMTELREKYGINAGVEFDADGQIYERYPKPTKRLPALTVPPIAFFPYIYQP
jgi:hypothetical protein